MEPTGEQAALRDAVRRLCATFDGAYWRDVDARRAYPEAFVDALTHAGYLAALVPVEYDGAGLGIAEASIILEEINRSGGNAAACHAQMYTMGTVLRHGSAEQKQRYLPPIARGELRLQAFGVTEPTAGSDTTKIATTAVRVGDLMWVTFPGEMFHAIGQRVKAACPATHAYLMGYTNGSIGYFPEQKAFAEGGYEPATSHLDPAAEPIYIRQVMELLQQFH